MSRPGTFVGVTVALTALLSPLSARSEAAGISLTGSLGAGHVSTSLIGSDLERFTSTNWDFLGQALLSGGGLDPNLLRWSVGANYGGLRTSAFGDRSASDRLGFRVNATILDGGRLPVTLLATRDFVDFSSDASAIQTTGTSRITTYGGTVRFKGDRQPSLLLSLTRTDTETERLTEPLAISSSTRLSVGAAQSVSRFNYDLGYDTSWNSGNREEFDYRWHAVRFHAAVPVSDTARFTVHEQYNLRLPTTAALLNPRLDMNVLGATYQWQPGPRLNSDFTYGYSNVGVAAAGAANSQQLAHTLSHTTHYDLSPRVMLLGGATLLSESVQNGGVTAQGFGQAVSTGVYWNLPLSWARVSAGATGRVGLAEPRDAPLRTTYGASANAGLNAELGRGGRGSLLYGGDFSSGGAATSFQSFTHSLRMEAELPVDTLLLRGALTGLSTRRDDPLLGTSLNRSLILTFDALSRRFSAHAAAGYVDGFEEPLQGPGLAGQFFLPVDFNTRTRYVLAGGSTHFFRGRLVVAAQARLAEIAFPGRASELERAGTVTASYAIGKFLLSLEDRYVQAGSDTLWRTNNTFMARITRSFGLSF